MSLDLDFRLFRFDAFAKNLALHEPELIGLFKCPFCFDVFTSEHLRHRNGHNTVCDAHVVPRSLMNAGTTLCCIQCDSKFGRTINSSERRRHVLRRLKWDGRVATCRTEAPTETGPNLIRTELRWDQAGEPTPTFHWAEHKLAISEAEFEEMWRSFPSRDRNGKPDDFILWKPFLYELKEKLADLSWWHSLYLFMFHHFGYSWTHEDPRSALIREQLLKPEKDIIPEQFIQPRVYEEIVAVPDRDTAHAVRPVLRFGYDKSGAIIDSGYFILFPKLHTTMNNISLFLPWEFDASMPRPEPYSFSERLRYGHSILRHRIPDPIVPADVSRYTYQVAQ